MNKTKAAAEISMTKIARKRAERQLRTKRMPIAGAKERKAR